MDDWKYGDVLRRATRLHPPEYSYVMFLGPGVDVTGRPARERFTGMRLTAIDVWPSVTANEVGWVGRRLLRDLFEKDPHAD